MAKVIKIHPENPHQRAIDQVVEVLRKGGLIVYPTDTVYGLGCDITNKKAMERLARYKGVKLEKANFSIVCNDLSHLASFSKPISTSHYKILKRVLPGPYTFVLPASKQLPSTYKNRKTVGIRVPKHLVPIEIAKALGNPIASTSIYDNDEVLEYTTDPEVLAEDYDKIVDLIVDSGYGNNLASTVIDMTEDVPTVIREGAGPIDQIV